MTEPHVTVTAHVTDRYGATVDVYAGSQPAWAWDVDRCAAWRKMKRADLLADRTSDPRGWRVTFTAVPEDDEDDDAGPAEGCPDCGGDTIAQDDPDDEFTAYCTNPRCGWRP